MDEIHAILADHRSKFKNNNNDTTNKFKGPPRATVSDIPDLFFDEILIEYKLNRMEIMVLMYLYRRVWSKPNLYKVYGISQLLSHTEMARSLNLTLEEIHHALRKIEDYGFIVTVRSGQYFVRKYFTRENDEKYLQTYDDFEI